MKNILILSALAFLISNCTLLDSHDHKHPHGAYGMKLFKQQDLNSDGVITEKEAFEYHKKMFDKADPNHNGKVGRAEAKKGGFLDDYNAIGKSRTKKGYITAKDSFTVEKKRFKAADKNGDGKVTKTEFKQHYLESFENKK